MLAFIMQHDLLASFYDMIICCQMTISGYGKAAA